MEFYRSGFESTDGGWTADADCDPAGDWQRGVPDAVPTNCDFRNQNGPPGAFEGTEVWGTRLGECYMNANGTSFLRQSFDFTTVVAGTLLWQQFLSIVNQDILQVTINGDVVYQSPPGSPVTADWEPVSVDLSAYAGLPNVEIVFSLFASTASIRPGWYIDDVIITSLVDPVFTEPPIQPAVGIFLAGNGDWYARGINNGGGQWVMKNGAIVAKTGDEIFSGAGEFWQNNPAGFPSGFFVIAGDNQGGYLIGGTTDLSDGVLVFYAPTVVAGIAAGRIVARAGDSVDLDGNGLFDDQATIIFFEGDGAIILEDGTIIVLMFIELPFPEGVVAAGTGSGAQGMGSFPPGTRGACCICDGHLPREPCLARPAVA